MADTNTEITTLDYVDGINVPGRVFDEPGNEYWALICLWHGLEFLCKQAEQSDRAVKEVMNPDGKFQTIASGNHPAFRLVSKTLLTCAFHWYAVTACQYVRTIGAIAFRNDDSRQPPPQYVQTVIPEVLAFRDKVAAHFAWSTQNRNDNDAERLASILPPLTFVNDSFHVGANKGTMGVAGKLIKSDAIEPWSICTVHERLSIVR